MLRLACYTYRNSIAGSYTNLHPGYFSSSHPSTGMIATHKVVCVTGEIVAFHPRAVLARQTNLSEPVFSWPLTWDHTEPVRVCRHQRFLQRTAAAVAYKASMAMVLMNTTLLLCLHML